MKLNLYEIRLLKREEYDRMVDFIRCHWNEKHIFCKHREIFEFQHGQAEQGNYDFVIAVHKESGEIHAVLGYITTSLYDKSHCEPQAIYGALWKVRDDVKNKEIGKLGLGVLYYLIKMYPDSTYITLGLSQNSQHIYNALHFSFGVMNHYYIANPSIKDYVIATNPISEPNKMIREDVVLERLNDIPKIENTFFPNKDREYIRNRYISHPIYQYELLGMFVGTTLKCIWVVRKITVQGSNCFRLVDMMGSMNGMEQICGTVQQFLMECNAEYIDCYNYGIEKEKFLAAGFHIVDGKTVIPNYFEPFAKKNIDIHYAYNGKKPVVIFKADGDQDRPNTIM